MHDAAGAGRYAPGPVMRRPGLALALALAAFPAVARAEGDAPSPAGADGAVVALVGGEVRPVSGPVLPRGTVLLRGGRIAAVGADVAVPEGARVIDCAGAVVTPGLIDADCALGLTPWDAGAGVPGADARAIDAFDGWDERLGTALREGVTALVLGANREQVLGGVACVVPTGPPGAAPLASDAAVVLNVSTRGAGGGAPGAFRTATIRGALQAALDRRIEVERWRRDLAEYEDERLAVEPTLEERLLLSPELLARMRLWTPAERAAWREATYKSMGREKAYTKPKNPATPPRAPGDDPNLDALRDALGDGATPAARRTLLRAELEGDVDAALRIAADFALTPVVAGGEGLRRRTAELARAHARVVLTHLGDTSASTTSAVARRSPGLAAALAAARLRPALGTGGVGAARWLRLFAAREIAEGLPRDAALAAVTLWAAESAGVEAQMGSLDAGKRGDVVVWSGDPFGATSRALHVFVEGAEVDVAAR